MKSGNDSSAVCKVHTVKFANQDCVSHCQLFRFVVQAEATAGMLKANTGIIETLVSQCKTLTIIPPEGAAPGGAAVSPLDANTTLYLHLKGLLDPAVELAKLQKQKDGAENKLAALKGRMEMPAYANTPEDRKAVDSEKLKELEAEVGNIESLIKDMEGLAAA
jgi:valyl-tRNA synthetase